MSTSTETTRTGEPSLAKATIDLVRYYLGGRRGLILLTVAILGAGLFLNWGWLVAVGVAPLLLALAPCAAMCALGLCMNKMGNQSGPTQSKSGAQGVAGTPPSITTPAAEVRDETLTAAVEPRISTQPTKGADMRNNFRTLLTTTAVLAALAGGSALYAYADAPNSPGSGGMMQGGQGGMPNMMGKMTPNSRSPGGMMQGAQGGMPNMMGMMNMMGQMTPNAQSSGGMMQGDQGGMPNMMGMMNMMGQMSQMMETYNNMMKEMPRHPGPGKPE